MAATVAHEVRNPLAGIQGFATLLRRDLHDRPELQTQVDRILLGVEGANRIVADLLEYSRPLLLHKEGISLEALLAESLAAAQISKRWTPQLQIDVDVDPVLPVCQGDRRLLLQVLNNLYDNAIDAMGGSGCLSVRARSAGGAGGERIRIVVRDNGCGLTAEEVARVFEPFYTSKPGGTGLGLAIVRRVVEAHRGHVHVVSAPGKGTSVVLELPTERRSEPIERSGRSKEPVSDREAA
jgi:signal transduction histidine kinase